MTTKVLVFESDSEFSQSLTTGLSAYGCECKVVEDGEEGIASASSDRPDLILLTIELPRMNGFSVCNKLKRNSELKSVPLVLLSSDATQETFEQHKRLRTRADQYVHKPVTVEELVLQLKDIVPLEKEDSSDEFEDVSFDDLEIEEIPESSTSVEDETDEAFGKLMAPVEPKEEEVELDELELEEGDGLEVAEESAEVEEETRVFDAGIVATEQALAIARQNVETSEVSGATQKPEEQVQIRTKEKAKAALTAELNEAVKRVKGLEEELSGARNATAAEEDAKAQALQKKDSEIEALEQEIEAVRAKMESSEASGTAREFLDLREQLNKKDKVILEIRDELSSKGKELIRSSDDNIAIAREKADLLDRVSQLESESVSLEKMNEALTNDKELASKRADEFKSKSESLGEELSATSTKLKGALESHENELATRDAQEAASRDDQKKALEDAAMTAAEDQARAVVEAVSQSEEVAAGVQEQALVVAAEDSKKAQELALSAREAELKIEQDSKLAALHRANEESLRKLRAEHIHESEEVVMAAAERLSAREGELAREKETELAAHMSASELAMSEVEEKLAGLEEELAARSTERDILAETLQQRDAFIVSLEATVATKRAEAVESSEQLARESELLKQARDKWGEDSASLFSAKEALAAASAQLEAALSRLMP